MQVNYDALASAYDRRYRDHDYSGVEAALLSFVGTGPGRRVLEAGCGTAHWIGTLGTRGTPAFGVDRSRNMLAQARINVPRCFVVHAAAERLPWTGRTFSHVFCINAFHHFEDKPAFLSEARRVLRPGGQLMIMGLDPHSGGDQWYIYDYFEPVLEIDRRRYASAAQIREWLLELGFAGVRTHEAQHLPGRLHARDALDTGRLGKGVTSQLAVLTDEEYERGLERIRADVAAAAARGEALYLHADLRMYATYGAVPP
jgi:ubiquinone/menaquinone biosynthesis C-methylase UbiE